MSKPKERPILFSGPMVRAILDGRKTQTRRAIKPQPFEHGSDGLVSAGWGWSIGQKCKLQAWKVDEIGSAMVKYCPHGKPGDRLWVREAHAIKPDSGHVVAYREGGECGAWCGDGAGGRFWIHHGHILEAPGYPFGLETLTTFGLCSFGGKWKPSIHMPRWASRITLEITAVRVERLQDISEADAIAEGVELRGGKAGVFQSHKQAFAWLWHEINGPESWAANPWVWAIEFRVVN